MIEIHRTFRYVTDSGHVQLVQPGTYRSLPAAAMRAADQQGATKAAQPPRNKMRGRPRNK